MQQLPVGMPPPHIGALLSFSCVYQDLAPFFPTSFAFDRPFLPHFRRRSKLCAGFIYSPWKAGFMRQHNIEMNWRLNPIKSPKVLLYYFYIK
jgi:hypothetical protein